jgi:hypothetical protein
LAYEKWLDEFASLEKKSDYVNLYREYMNRWRGIDENKIKFSFKFLPEDGTMDHILERELLDLDSIYGKID